MYDYYRVADRKSRDKKTKDVIRKWECPECECKSDIVHEHCPNGCDMVDRDKLIGDYHKAVNTFFEYHIVDSFDHCTLTLNKEFDKMKKLWWEVKEKILDKK